MNIFLLSDSGTVLFKDVKNSNNILSTTTPHTIGGGKEGI